MRIKICGVTTAADARLAASLGADSIGLNFYPQSPRYVDPARARQVMDALPRPVRPVGVFVGPSAEELGRCLAALGLRTIQLHATAPEVIRESHSGLPLAVILAQGVSSTADLEILDGLLATWRESGVEPTAVLLDARVPGLHGGTGQTAPWALLAEYNLGVPMILAGGLTPENVAEAIRIVRPDAVDVASGVEQSPGIKDEEKLRRFIGNAREAAARFSTEPRP